MLTIPRCLHGSRGRFQRLSPRWCAVAGRRDGGVQVELPTPASSELCGRFLAAHMRKHSQLVVISGDLGAGKSVVARGLIRARCGDASLRVTSPTYLLQNSYTDSKGRSVHHFDFYRTLELPSVEGVDWEGSLGDLCVVEWPHPALPLPERFVRVHLALGVARADRAEDAAGEEEDAEPRTADVEFVGGAQSSHLASGLTDPLVWRQWGLHATPSGSGAASAT